MKKLPPPTSQIQEVLYLLIERLYIDRRSVMLESNIHNLPARIEVLRRKGLRVKTTMISAKNKYGRSVEFGQYSITGKRDAVQLYKSLKAAGCPAPVNDC